jgi:hypothetical protein
MRFLGSWWERVPVQQVGAVIAAVMFVGIVGAQFTASNDSISSQAQFISKPSGEVWH